VNPAAAIFFLAALVAIVCISRRRRFVRPVDEDVAPEASARELIASRLAIISERIRESGGDPDGRAMRDAQAAWAREQERITSDSVVVVVQRLRAAIVHTGAAEARAVLEPSCTPAQQRRARCSTNSSAKRLRTRKGFQATSSRSLAYSSTG
jgi:hypothetical protein